MSLPFGVGSSSSLAGDNGGARGDSASYTGSISWVELPGVDMSVKVIATTLS